MHINFKILLIIALTLSSFACSNNSKISQTDENTPLSEQITSKRQAEREWGIVKDRIYEKYNLTANDEDKITCKMERVTKKKRKRKCLTNQHRKNLEAVAKSELCTQTSVGYHNSTKSSGCMAGGAGHDLTNQVVNSKAANQMKRINQEIIQLAKNDPELTKLLKKSMELQKIHETF